MVEELHPFYLKYYKNKKRFAATLRRKAKGTWNRKKTRDDRIRAAFETHKSNAQSRGIDFDFTFDEWCAWWEKHLGKDWVWKRGSYAGQYVMARYYDDGPYAAHNVKCITASKNVSEIKKNKRIKGG